MSEPADSKTEIELRKVLKLDPEDLKELYRKSNVIPGLYIAAVYGGLVATFFALQRWQYPAVYFAGFVIVAGLQHHLHMIQHEAIHHVLFTNRKLGEWLGRISGCMIGFTMDYRILHMDHHEYLGEQGDPDWNNYQTYPKRRWALLFDVLIDLSGIRSVTKYIQVQKHNLLSSKSKGRAFFLGREYLVLMVVQGVLFTAIAVFCRWWMYLIFWILPLVTLTKVLARIRNLAEHIQNPRIAHPVVGRLRTITSNPIERFFFAPLNFNFHAEHHLYPGIPFYHLPRAFEIISQKPSYREFVDVEGSYLGVLLRKVGGRN